jgi:integrase
MAHIETRTLGNGKKSYKVRYIDPDGRERARSFRRKAQADDFALEVAHTVRAGSYVDPGAGRVTVRQYLEQWRTQQAQHRPRTADTTARRFRTMVYPLLGDRPIAQVKPSTIRTWQAQLVERYATATIASVRGTVAGAFNDAVLDRLIPSNPFDNVKAPDIIRDRVVPRTVEQIRAGERALPDRFDRYRAVIPFSAGTGLRFGELFGLTVDRVNFLRSEVTVDRQLVARRGAVPIFGPPKTDASERTIPIARSTRDRLAAHLARYPARPGTGWWRTGDAGRDEPLEHPGLIFVTGRGTPVVQDLWLPPWKHARAAMGLGAGDGLHQLRHFYASLLIAEGLNVKEVQERLGHASAQETLDTYAHLFPGSDDRTRAAIERTLGTHESGAAPKDDAANT